MKVNGFKPGGEACPMISGGFATVRLLKRLGLTPDAMDTAEALADFREICLDDCDSAGKCLGEDPFDDDGELIEVGVRLVGTVIAFEQGLRIGGCETIRD